MQCIGVYFIKKSNQNLNNIGQQNINKSFNNLSKITPESFKNHAKMIQNDKKVSHVTPKRASSTRGSNFGAPKYQNGAKMEAKMRPKSSKNLKKTSSKNAMISERCFSRILMIFDFILDQFFTIFYHFFKKSEKLKNAVFYYGF